MGKASGEVFRRTRRKARRTNIQFDKAAFDEHVSQIGEIVYLWNRLHGQLFLIFWSLTDRSNHDFAFGIWHSIQSDSAQRQMVESAAKSKLKKRLSGHVLWICRGHERLSKYRNAFAHVGFYYDWKNGFVPNDLDARRSAVELFSAQPKVETFRKLRGDLMSLVEYAEDVAMRIFYDIENPASPWAERPRLQLAPATPPSRAKKQQTKLKPGGQKQ